MFRYYYLTKSQVIISKHPKMFTFMLKKIYTETNV